MTEFNQFYFKEVVAIVKIVLNKINKKILIFALLIILAFFVGRLFILNLSDSKIVKVTILEGYRIVEISNLLEANKIISSRDFKEALKKDYSQTFDFLKDKPKNLTLEGYLFPDTYEFWQGEQPESIIKKFLINFDKKLNQKLRKDIKKRGKNIHQVVVMASILEKEVSKIEDKKKISDILWRRLEIGFPLQVDATYIFGGFNSYENKGLPSQPICNPGLESLIAAIYPQENNFWFYFSHNDIIIYSENYREHLIKKMKLRNEI